MKKIFSIITICVVFLFSVVQADESVSVYAKVGVINSTPRFEYITPDFSPVLIKATKLQSFEFAVNDEEQDTIYYTITADHGNISPINGSLPGSGAVNFVYLAPINAVGATKIYITLNDGPNFYNKEIKLYIY